MSDTITITKTVKIKVNITTADYAELDRNDADLALDEVLGDQEFYIEALSEQVDGYVTWDEDEAEGADEPAFEIEVESVEVA